jgi:propionyl-CoA carboxylase alpha chain
MFVCLDIEVQVQAGDELVVVEAMKMQNVLRAERNGVVKAIHAKPGQPVSLDQILIEFEQK